jgi:uncharacterized protein (TIGR02678 family)
VSAERRRALRALLRNPQLPSFGESAEDYSLVRRHAEWLKQWLAQFPAWTLRVDKEVARLYKTPPDFADDTRPAVDRDSGTVFSKRRYALLCLTLAALEQSDRQTTLGLLSRTVAEFAAADRRRSIAVLLFDMASYDHRRDLIYAIRLLIERGVLRRLEGNEKDFLDRVETSDVLYDINRPVLASILNVSRSASVLDQIESEKEKSLATRVASLVDESSIRARLIRTLLDDPVLYFDDLNEEERLYFENHRSYLLREICEATGLVAEVRREGVALVDGDGNLSDVWLPDESPDGALSLELIQWLAERYTTNPQHAIPISALEEVCPESVPGSLIPDALRRLRELRLVQLTPEGVVPSPACGRYRRPLNPE